MSVSDRTWTDSEPWRLEPMETAAPIIGDVEDTERDGRTVRLIPASSIRPRPVLWLWHDRLALGTLGLLAGREGVGKSCVAYWLAARITRGELPGCYLGAPKAVLVCASEDSWEHTIVPRLIAAGADMDRVFRIDVVTPLGFVDHLMLPADLPELERISAPLDAALLLIDPMMARLGQLDTHRDNEVRQALEPLVRVADHAGFAVLALIHHNKTGSTDPLQLVMGSKAFTAVARSVHTVIPDTEDETRRQRLFGTPKNNLGRSDLSTLTMTIESREVATEDGPAWTGFVVWGEDKEVSIDALMRRGEDDDPSETSECADWLRDLLTRGGRISSRDVKAAAQRERYSEKVLRRARERLGVTVHRYSGGSTDWELHPASMSSIAAPS